MKKSGEKKEETNIDINILVRRIQRKFSFSIVIVFLLICICNSISVYAVEDKEEDEFADYQPIPIADYIAIPYSNKTKAKYELYGGLGLGTEIGNINRVSNMRYSDWFAKREASGIAEAVFIGGRGLFTHFNMGLELNFNYTMTHCRDYLSMKNPEIRIDVRKQWDLGLHVTPGMMFGNNCIGYLKYGFVYSKIGNIDEINVNGIKYGDFTEKIPGTIYGAGIEGMINDIFSIRTEYTYTVYWRRQLGDGQSGRMFAYSIQPKIHQIVIECIFRTCNL